MRALLFISFIATIKALSVPDPRLRKKSKIETDSKKPGQDQKLTVKKNSIFELST